MGLVQYNRWLGSAPLPTHTAWVNPLLVHRGLEAVKPGPE
jgi:hypothetical protein